MRADLIDDAGAVNCVYKTHGIHGRPCVAHGGGCVNRGGRSDLICDPVEQLHHLNGGIHELVYHDAGGQVAAFDLLLGSACDQALFKGLSGLGILVDYLDEVFTQRLAVGLGLLERFILGAGEPYGSERHCCSFAGCDGGDASEAERAFGICDGLYVAANGLVPKVCNLEVGDVYLLCHGKIPFSVKLTS